jgi:hypothetical protein
MKQASLSSSAGSGELSMELEIADAEVRAAGTLIEEIDSGGA